LLVASIHHKGTSKSEKKRGEKKVNGAMLAIGGGRANMDKGSAVGAEGKRVSFNFIT